MSTLTAQRCRHCDVNLPGATARICVACYRKYLRRCTNCMDAKGHLLRQFQDHKDDGKEDLKGRQQPCSRCGKHHPFHNVQIVCPNCKNERMILDEPEVVA